MYNLVSPKPRRDTPAFASWSLDAVVQFATEAYDIMCDQQDALEELRGNLKAAIQVNRDLIINQERNHHDDWK